MAIPLPLAFPPAVQAPLPQSRIAVRMDLSEADAVLALLDLRARGQEPGDADWAKLFATEGYRRLKRREASMGRPFEDVDFRAFVLSADLLSRALTLKKAVETWRRLDPAAAAHRALAYLPAEARIRATLYPVIKPQGNSFVFEAETDPAIFLFVDPSRSGAQEENTLVHEFHHIGFASVRPAEDESLPSPRRLALRWTGAFGEGFAMLAAAGSPTAHPHAVSPAADRARWDRDMAAFPRDFDRLAAFLGRLLDGSLRGEQATEAAFAFYGVQGPWYTVGWRMASLIETRLGRARLLEVYRDLSTLYRTWNEVADLEAKATGQALPHWSQALVEAVERRR
ncbi:DUF5700 domain-containing putative Zn-dependent protease [Geothrix sp. 21YS21S-4]|uniref:DUF5700 domain-containing putative Zn-dependent protease n=1 Tax=Geothrix sp. 21YS21S-4 TaxID=3068889 RepID=UPI0027BA4B1F|nr:DUF5700 domain-containing putative Zn-dependent protease [Geothrix sp. 21YS21S-4]